VRVCKDCKAEGVTTVRLTPHPGPRCATHHRAERTRTQGLAHARHIAVNYALEPGDYTALFNAQGGYCAICRKARGMSARLAVDHNHSCDGGHPPTQGCSQCIRGLLCKRCNALIGFLDVAALTRAINYLLDPPARYVLRRS
jgi:Recombination endonuclease VII